MNNQQQSSAALPCLGSISSFLNPDQDTNFLSDLVPNKTMALNFVVEFIKVSYEKLDKDTPLFKSAKELEWATEIIGYAFIPPHSKYIIEERNYIRCALNIYEFLLITELEILRDERSSFKTTNNQQVLNYADKAHQKIMLKMLTQMTLLFEASNFVEQKPNSLIGDPRMREAEHRVVFNLCAQVLKIYNKFIFKAYSYLYSDHWEYVLKLLLGLTSHILKGIPASNNQPKIKFSEKIAVSIIELVYNAWMLSGLQNEKIWTMFKDHICRLINHHHGIISYWSDICHELTAKILMDSQSFEPPELIIQKSKANKIRCNNKDLLIINHNYIPKENQVSLFVQPFIFDIAQNQVQYLWERMITITDQINQNMMTSFTNTVLTPTPTPTPINPKVSLLINKSIRRVIELLLKSGAHSKSQDETFVFSEKENNIYEYRLENQRKIIIEHHFSHFKDLLDEMNPNFEQIQQEEDFINDEKEYILKVNTGERSSKQTLFKLFGKFLFENAADTRSKYENTRSDAVCTLCLIFSKAQGPFYEETLQKFYQVYLGYLKSIKSWENFQALLECSTDLFLPGYLLNNITLQKPLMKKMQHFYKLPKGDEAFQGKPLERKTCNKMCSSLLCYISYESQADRYSQTIKYIFSELLELAFTRDFEEFSLSVSNENKAEIIRSSWNLMIFSILNNKILAFVDRLFYPQTTENPSKYGKNSTSVKSDSKEGSKPGWLEESSSLVLNELGIQILLVLGEMNLRRLDQFESDTSEDIFDCGLKIIELIVQFIGTRIKEFKIFNSDSQKLKIKSKSEEERILSIKAMILKSFEILCTWFAILTKLKETDKKMQFLSIFEQVLDTLEKHLEYKLFSESIKGLISCCNYLLKGNNIHLTSSTIFKNHNQEYEEQCVLSIGINDEAILSFYDSEIEQNNQALLFVVRNAMGRFIGFGELESQLISNRVKSPEEFLKEKTSRTQEILQDSSNYYKIKLNNSHKNEEPKIKQSIEHEEIYDKENPEEQKENRSGERLSKMSAIRTFLFNAGIISNSPHNILSNIPLDKNSREALKEIDQSLVRCQIFSSIFYVQEPSSEKIDEFSQSDPLFQKFLNNFGVIIDDQMMGLKVHEVPRPKPILYASNPLYEIMFSLPNLSASKLNNSSETLETTPITVIWNAEVFAPYESPSCPRIINRLNLKGNNVTIIISPINEDSYCLNILKKDTDLITFSPVESFVCSEKILVSAVFQTIISLSQKYQFETDYLETIFEKISARKEVIQTLIKSSTGQEDIIEKQFQALINRSLHEINDGL